MIRDGADSGDIICAVLLYKKLPYHLVTVWWNFSSRAGSRMEDLFWFSPEIAGK